MPYDGKKTKDATRRRVKNVTIYELKLIPLNEKKTCTVENNEKNVIRIIKPTRKQCLFSYWGYRNMSEKNTANAFISVWKANLFLVFLKNVLVVYDYFVLSGHRFSSKQIVFLSIDKRW